MRKDNKEKKGQAIFEYFILTIIVVSIALYFAQNNNFIKVQDAGEEVFNLSVASITDEAGGSGSNPSGGFGGNGGFGGGGAGGR